MNKHFFSIIFIFSFLLSLSFVSADCFFDKDCDGWWDINDNCPDNYNPFQEDINNNDIGDICEHQPVFSVQIQNLSWVWNTNKTMDLSQYFLDLDGDELTYFSNGLNQIIVSFKGNIATFTPPINWTGTEILTINATDGLTSVQSNAFSLLVFMPNMAPTVSIISPTNNQAFQTSSQINFVSKANDPNNDLLNYAWTFGDGTTAIGENATHAYATNGTFKVIVSVSDGEFSANDSVFVNVLNPKTNNSAPFWVFSVPDVSLFEDFGLFTHVLDLVSLVFDVDSDVLFFSVV
ncbi:MAG: PKD domain-containing protein, partial [Nanoarchaeota archaeon]|nr:PKD domain-containing protein [Nanoarchaeota archaeon]MBU1029778.1 PKD domain-containing protein [Nanoarchaeota archaeon]MBU1849215.1 PKD domain-containing protein [Nanoarchaeota archaeon]